MTDLSLFRIYEPHECGPDGYPFKWHREALSEPPHIGIKHLVREDAGDRCIRCRHRFVVGLSGVWERGEGVDKKLWNALRPELFDRDVVEPPRGMRHGGVNWSSCDEECRHAGPMRGWTGDRWAYFDGGPYTAVRSGYERVEAAWRILTVHHLNERKFDCRWHNLCSLCQRCHLYIQRKVSMEQVWPLEHSDWFKPYAAAFYAYSYLGEELTREQTMARLDELLTLERVA